MGCIVLCRNHTLVGVSLSIIMVMILQYSECLATSLPFDTGQTSTNNTSIRNLQRVRVIGSDPSPWLLPLGECMGDCDSDFEVRAWLYFLNQKGKNPLKSENVCPGNNRERNQMSRLDIFLKNVSRHMSLPLFSFGYDNSATTSVKRD